MNSSKLIFNPTLARWLVSQGARIVGLKSQKEDSTKLVFVFQVDAIFSKAMDEYMEHSQSKGVRDVAAR